MMTFRAARARRVLVSGLFALVILFLHAQAGASATLTVNTSVDENVPDGALSIREAFMLASGALARPLTTAEKGQITGVSPQCWRGVGRPGEGPGFWVFAPAEPGSVCPGVGDGYADTIVFASNVSMIRVTGTPFDGLSLGNMDTIDGSLGGGNKVILDGTNSGWHVGIELLASGSYRVLNLVIQNFKFNAIAGYAVKNSVFQGLDLRMNGEGIYLESDADGPSHDNLIGGPELSQRNFIHGNKEQGIYLAPNLLGSPPANFNNSIVNNFIGLDPNGNVDGNGQNGIHIVQQGGDTISGNVISGNKNDGIKIEGNFSMNNVIRGNFIGTSPDGATGQGNQESGVSFSDAAGMNTVGGTGAGQGNVIAFNKHGVWVGKGSRGNSIRGNSIFANTASGIEQLDQPEILLKLSQSANPGTISMRITGTLSGKPSTAYEFDIFYNDSCDQPSQGRYFKSVTPAADAQPLMTDGSGNATIDFGLVRDPGQAPNMTVTATERDGKETSAFSNCISIEKYAKGGLKTGGGKSPPFVERRTNWALASNGSTATATSTIDPFLSPGRAIDGDRTGWVNGRASFWASNVTLGQTDILGRRSTETLEVDFNGNKSVEEIDLFGAQDDPSHAQEPTPQSTFTRYGLRDFDVQYWNDAPGHSHGWQTIPNGHVVNNNLIWNKFQLPNPIKTSRVRVVISRSGDNNEAFVVELEAWGTTFVIIQR